MLLDGMDDRSSRAMLEILETKIEALGHPVKTIIAKVFLNRLKDDTMVAHASQNICSYAA